MRLLLLTLFATVLTACTHYKTTTVTLPDGFEVKVRLADTPQKQEKGLMFVKNLKENEGMLFTFNENAEQIFWMKNTLIDLDIVFIKSNKVIDSVANEVEHSYTYTPDAEVAIARGYGQYVLELTAKTAQKHGVIPGAKIDFDLTGK